MNDKEIAELRRRFRPDRSNITHICGCYISQQKEIISKFDLSLGLMPEDEKEKYLALLKKTMSGPQNKNLINITFRTQQVADSDEHRLLMALRETKLKDGEILQRFYETVIPTVNMETNFVILLANDIYDVLFKAKDGAELEDDGNTHSYIVCSVCPVKMTKPVLRYVADESEFHNTGTDFIIAGPELGFLFPAFDGRRTNLYNALYYTHNVKDSNEEFVKAIFNTEPPMPAASQKATFQTLLGDALEEECSYELVEAVHTELCERMEAHKAAREPEPLTICREDVEAVLEARGISEQHVAAFNVEFDNAFGTDAMVSPRNLVESRKFEVCTPDVVIKVNPERRDLVQTKTIGGKQYILISAEENIEVNGISIHLPD